MTALAEDHLSREAFANARPALFASLRFPVYIFNIISLDGWAQDRTGIVLFTLAAFAVDVAVAIALDSTKRSLLWLRVPLDFAYVCLAADAVPPTWPYSGVLLILVPTAVEIVAVRGLILGALYVGVADTAMYVSRTSIGANPYVFELVFYGAWMLIIGTVGFAAFQAVAYQHRRRFLTEQQAFRTLIYLQTRNELLLGRGGTITEALNRAWWLLENILGDSVREARLDFRDRQEGLTADTRGQAMYLKDALMEITAQQRSGRALVADHLHLTIDRVHGQQVLSVQQIEALARQIGAISATGQQVVNVHACDQITGELHLTIGDNVVYVPPARGRKIRLVLAAVIFGAGALIALANPIYANLPLVPTCAAIIVALIAGITAERTSGAHAGRRVFRLWLAALVPASLALTLTVLFPVNWKLADGRIIIPGIVGLTSSLYVVGVIWGDLNRRLRWLTVAYCAVWMTLELALSPFGSPPWRSILGNLVIPASVVLAVLVFDMKNTNLGLRLHEQWTAQLKRHGESIRRDAMTAEVLALEGQVKLIEELLLDSDEGLLKTKALQEVGEAKLHLSVLR